MAEDYTYDAVTDVTTLRRTAQEANQYALCMEDKANELATRVQELERENAELKQRCTHMERRLRSMLIDAIVNDGDPNTLTLDWGQLNDTQPDDTDAPLTLAAIDENGDE